MVANQFWLNLNLYFNNCRVITNCYYLFSKETQGSICGIILLVSVISNVQYCNDYEDDIGNDNVSNNSSKLL